MMPRRAPITIDCGNSTIDCRHGPSGRRERIGHGDAAAAALQAFLRPLAPAHIVAVSVVPAALDVTRRVAAEVGCEVRVAGVDLPCPLRIDYATPATLGADRWVGCLAAHRRFGAAVVVDCGTATTVNVVDAGGAFRGGVIAPGLPAIVAGMAARTPALPAPFLDAADPAPVARSTQAAVDAGVLLGYAGMVERLVAGALASMPVGATVVLTGGHAERVARHVRLGAQIVPDLVHAGLEALAETASWSG